MTYVTEESQKLRGKRSKKIADKLEIDKEIDALTAKIREIEGSVKTAEELKRGSKRRQDFPGLNFMVGPA